MSFHLDNNFEIDWYGGRKIGEIRENVPSTGKNQHTNFSHIRQWTWQLGSNPSHPGEVSMHPDWYVSLLAAVSFSFLSLDQRSWGKEDSAPIWHFPCYACVSITWQLIVGSWMVSSYNKRICSWVLWARKSYSRLYGCHVYQCSHY